MLLLPVLAVETGGRAAWMVAVISGVLGFLLLLLIGKMSQRFPTITFAGYASRIAGPWAGKGMALLLGIALGLGAAVDIQVALKNVVGLFFLTTPPWVVAGLLALTGLAVSWFGVVAASRLAPLVLSMLLLTFLFVLLPLWRYMELGYLVPFWDPTPLQPQSRAFWAALGAFRSGPALAALMPYIAEPRRAVRVAGWAYWAGWLVVFLAVLAPVLVFGPEGARSLVLPFPFVASVIRLPNFPLERIELLARLVFNLNVFHAIALMYFNGGQLLSEVFNTRTTRPFMVAVVVLSVVPVLTVYAALPGEVLTGWFLISAMVLFWSFFSLLWLIYWLRGMGRAGGAPTRAPYGGR